MKLTSNRIAQMKRDAKRHAKVHAVSLAAAQKAVAKANGYANWEALQTEARRQDVQLNAKQVDSGACSCRPTSAPHRRAPNVAAADPASSAALDGTRSFSQGRPTVVGICMVHRSSELSRYYRTGNCRGLRDSLRAAAALCSSLPSLVCRDFAPTGMAIDNLWAQFQDKWKKAQQQQ